MLKLIILGLALFSGAAQATQYDSLMARPGTSQLIRNRSHGKVRVTLSFDSAEEYVGPRHYEVTCGYNESGSVFSYSYDQFKFSMAVSPDLDPLLCQQQLQKAHDLLSSTDKKAVRLSVQLDDSRRNLTGMQVFEQHPIDKTKVTCVKNNSIISIEISSSSDDPSQGFATVGVNPIVNGTLQVPGWSARSNGIFEKVKISTLEGPYGHYQVDSISGDNFHYFTSRQGITGFSVDVIVDGHSIKIDDMKECLL